jgi:hypothetical protein
MALEEGRCKMQRIGHLEKTALRSDVEVRGNLPSQGRHAVLAEGLAAFQEASSG